MIAPAISRLLGLRRSTVSRILSRNGMGQLQALDRKPEMRPVLCLFEGVATGAADGYARIAEKPACTLLHLGPGYGNGLANLHNARRAFTPVVNVIGDHATYHRQYDPPLASDVEALAGAVSAWVRRSTSAANVGMDAAAAVQAARTLPGQVATLILPADSSWNPGGVVGTRLEPPPDRPIGIAEKLIDRAFAGVARHRPFEGGDRLGVVALEVIGIADRIGDRGIVRRQAARLFDERLGFGDVLTPLELGVAEVVQHDRLIRRQRQRLAQRGLSLLPVARPLQRAAAQHPQRPQIATRRIGLCRRDRRSG
jgi:hypothetical protein